MSINLEIKLLSVSATCHDIDEYSHTFLGGNDDWNYDSLDATQNESDEREYESSTSNIKRRAKKRGTIDFITPRVIAALDKCKVSSRFSDHLLSAVAAALGHRISDLVINRKSIELRRKKYREEMAQKMKAGLKESVISFRTISS